MVPVSGIAVFTGGLTLATAKPIAMSRGILTVYIQPSITACNSPELPTFTLVKASFMKARTWRKQRRCCWGFSCASLIQLVLKVFFFSVFNYTESCCSFLPTSQSNYEGPLFRRRPPLSFLPVERVRHLCPGICVYRQLGDHHR